MAAFIPSRRDPKVNETALARVAEDKKREANDGFDGTWVAHPDLISTAREHFDAVLGDAPHQVARQRDDVAVTAARLTDLTVPGSAITEAGVRANISIGIQYLASWLRGTGAVGIFNLMEDTATAEISRSQLWQWVQRGADIGEGVTVTADLVRGFADEEMAKIRQQAGDELFAAGRYEQAWVLLEQMSLGQQFPEFLTHAAYELID
jgi:malate synthase